MGKKTPKFDETNLQVQEVQHAPNPNAPKKRHEENYTNERQN